MSYRTRLADRLAPAKTRIAARLGELISYTNRGVTAQLYAKVGPEELVSKEVLGTDSDETARTFSIPRQFIPIANAFLQVPDTIFNFEIDDTINFDGVEWAVTSLDNPDGKRIEWDVLCVRTHPRRLK